MMDTVPNPFCLKNSNPVCLIAKVKSFCCCIIIPPDVCENKEVPSNRGTFQSSFFFHEQWSPRLRSTFQSSTLGEISIINHHKLSIFGVPPSPKSSISIVFPLTNQPFWVPPWLRNPPYFHLPMFHLWGPATDQGGALRRDTWRGGAIEPKWNWHDLAKESGIEMIQHSYLLIYVYTYIYMYIYI